MKMTLKDGRVIEGSPEEMAEILGTLAARTKRRRPTVAFEHSEFAVFWGHYPRKVARHAAMQAFAKAAARDKPEFIMAGLRKALAYWEGEPRTDAQYIPHAATWLNQRRYEDAGDTDIQNQIVEEAKRKLASGT